MVRDGYLYGIGFLAAAVLLHFFTAQWIFGWVLTAVPVLLAIFFLWFFRDPRRAIPQGAGLVVSPADGKVTEVARVRTPNGDHVRLSIFLNVFDVHVNRAPITGTVRDVVYKQGKYLNALNPASAEQNEQTAVTLQGDGCIIVFKLIAGLLARRIVFLPKAGDRLERGQRVGMIKFGSRCDVLLPADAHVRVERGQRVKGGASILADVEIPVPEPALLRDVMETRA